MYVFFPSFFFALFRFRCSRPRRRLRLYTRTSVQNINVHAHTRAVTAGHQSIESYTRARACLFSRDGQRNSFVWAPNDDNRSRTTTANNRNAPTDDRAVFTGGFRHDGGKSRRRRSSSLGQKKIVFKKLFVNDRTHVSRKLSLVRGLKV